MAIFGQFKYDRGQRKTYATSKSLEIGFFQTLKANISRQRVRKQPLKCPLINKLHLMDFVSHVRYIYSDGVIVLRVT